LEDKLESRINNSVIGFGESSEKLTRREREIELLAQMKDIKRKRQSYHVIKIKNQTEISPGDDNNFVRVRIVLKSENLFEEYYRNWVWMSLKSFGVNKLSV